MYHYAGNNPVKYVDPDGRDDFYSEYVRDMINAETLDFQNSVDDFRGRIGNFFSNLFNSNGTTVNVEGNITIGNIKFGGSFEIKDGECNIKSDELKDSILDDTVGMLQKLAGSPIVITSNDISVSAKLLSVSVGKEGNKNPHVGLSISLPKLPEGFDISAGISISASTDYGPYSTSTNPSPEMRQRACQSEYLKNPIRFIGGK